MPSYKMLLGHPGVQDSIKGTDQDWITVTFFFGKQGFLDMTVGTCSRGAWSSDGNFNWLNLAEKSQFFP